MSINESIIWFTIIFGADIIAMMLYNWYTDRKGHDHKCDWCNEIAKLHKIRGKKLWLCKGCKDIKLGRTK